MKKSLIAPILLSAGFTHDPERGSGDRFEKQYKCGARVSYSHSAKDERIMLNWFVDYKSNFTYPKDFPMVNQFHFCKGTTFHSVEDFAESLAHIEEEFKIS